ncbi:MAG: hypothetical protein AAGE96_14485 [Cyanobacteria bacterium P01_G01_bin.19]
MLQAKIVNDPEVRDGKWGKYILIKTKVLKTGEDIAIFGKLNDEVANSKTRGEIVTIAKNGNGKYKIVAPVENKRSNQGLTPVKEIIKEYINDDLGLPELLTDQQKKNLHNLCVERARLLTHCIDVMAKEMDNKGMEVYESSAKSLGVSLFIHITKFLP